jgi:hypothetical protein
MDSLANSRHGKTEEAMDAIETPALVSEIRKIQEKLSRHIEETFNEIVLVVESSQMHASVPERGADDEAQYSQTLSIMNTGAMKGRKPISVLLDGEVIVCPTWKRVFEAILRKCNAIPEKHSRLMAFRNQYFGNKRVLLAENKNQMRSPAEIDKGLFVETHYDTTSLMNLLLRILRDLDYDYRDIKVTVRS